ncbi:MAG TPA: Holliday junction branch migration protein RuvA [Syntrophomonadaceae bacterium]|nr:Holliday junction branch migration protein RuvA [Syntrophomonadaceae bacterium]
MIAYLKGVLAEVELDFIIVEVGGIGYHVTVHSRTFSHLPAVGEDVFISTYLHITDNEYKLFGFIDKDEKQLFEKIISVSGIGPKVALSALSTMDSYTFCTAIVNEDDKTLTTIPGIGKKGAARLIFELRDKVVSFAPQQDDASSVGINETIEALEVLGYKTQELMPIINELNQQGQFQSDTSFNIKLVLQKINLKNG